MAIFTMEIKESLSRVVSVAANDIEEAMRMVSKKYKNEEIVLDDKDYKVLGVRS